MPRPRVKITWRAPQVQRAIEGKVRQRMEAAGAYAVRQLRHAVGRQGTRWNRSRPGEPPRRQNGRLQRSIRYWIDQWTLFIGSDIEQPPYPRYLEAGTRTMRPRPWLLATMARIQSRLWSILRGQ
jgi:hypothetical protein